MSCWRDCASKAGSLRRLPAACGVCFGSKAETRQECGFVFYPGSCAKFRICRPVKMHQVMTPAGGVADEQSPMPCGRIAPLLHVLEHLLHLFRRCKADVRREKLSAPKPTQEDLLSIHPTNKDPTCGPATRRPRRAGRDVTDAAPTVALHPVVHTLSRVVPSCPQSSRSSCPQAALWRVCNRQQPPRRPEPGLLWGNRRAAPERAELPTVFGARPAGAAAADTSRGASAGGARRGPQRQAAADWQSAAIHAARCRQAATRSGQLPPAAWSKPGHPPPACECSSPGLPPPPPLAPPIATPGRPGTQ